MRPASWKPPASVAKLPDSWLVAARRGLAWASVFLAAALPAGATIIQVPAGQPETPGPMLTLKAGPLGRIIQVGPSRQIKSPSQAAAIVQTGDVVEIDADSYVGDVASWNADNLTIRGVGGRARLLAAGQTAENKATWVIKGRNTIVENIEFAEATAVNGNGAGIRAEGINLKVINCYFHDNQEGILGALDTTDSRVDIENSNLREMAEMAAAATKSI